MGALVAYLKAFYHGLEVRVLPVALSFMAWEGDPTSRSGKSGQSGPTRDDQGECVGLSTSQLRMIFVVDGPGVRVEWQS